MRHSPVFPLPLFLSFSPPPFFSPFPPFSSIFFFGRGGGGGRGRREYEFSTYKSLTKVPVGISRKDSLSGTEGQETGVCEQDQLQNSTQRKDEGNIWGLQRKKKIMSKILVYYNQLIYFTNKISSDTFETWGPETSVEYYTRGPGQFSNLTLCIKNPWAIQMGLIFWPNKLFSTHSINTRDPWTWVLFMIKPLLEMDRGFRVWATDPCLIIIQVPLPFPLSHHNSSTPPPLPTKLGFKIKTKETEELVSQQG